MTPKKHCNLNSHRLWYMSLLLVMHEKKRVWEKCRNNFESKGDVSDVFVQNAFFPPFKWEKWLKTRETNMERFFSVCCSLFVFFSFWKRMTMCTTCEHYANAAISMLTPPGNDVAKMPQWFQRATKWFCSFKRCWMHFISLYVYTTLCTKSRTENETIEA